MNEWTAELYAHAIAIEREAAQRYSALGEKMAEQGHHAVAVLFFMLASFEGRHQGEAPETVGFEACAGDMTPERALVVALDAERRAKAFFEHAARLTNDPATRALAREMADEEAEHATLVERTLERVRKRVLEGA